jgi:hypothetical protein
MFFSDFFSCGFFFPYKLLFILFILSSSPYKKNNKIKIYNTLVLTLFSHELVSPDRFISPAILFSSSLSSPLPASARLGPPRPDSARLGPPVHSIATS